MMKLIVLLSILVCVFALPSNIQKRDVDKIAFPDEGEASTSSSKIEPQKIEDPLASKGNGTDLDNRFLGIGLGLGIALGQKLLGGHGGHGNYPGHYPQPYHGGGFSGSQSQAQAQSQSFGGGFGGYGGSQSQAQAQSQSFGGGFGGYNPYYG